MKNNPRISIVTPSYNQAKFLEETILSVINQNYDNLEYIIIDGGSNDNSIEIIKKYEKYLTYWFSEKDGGQTEAINKGLKKITGDIWAFICSDDVYSKGAFEKCIKTFEDNPKVDAIYGDCNFINSEGIVTRVKKPPKFDRSRLLKGNYIYQPSVFCRNKTIKEFGYFNENLDFGMDYEYWLRISQKKNMMYVDYNFSNYRLHSNSKSMKSIVKQQKDVRDIKINYGVGGLYANISFLKFLLVGKYFYLLKRIIFDLIVHIRK